MQTSGWNKTVPVRHLIGMISALALLVLGVQMAVAQQETPPRIALLVGNGAYSSVEALDNPVPDADLMAATLEERGFRVTLLTDANQIALNRAIAQFGRDLRDAGPDATGLFYYAGHAVQSFGNNYLLPTDASLTDAADLSLVAVPAQAVLRQMFSARNRTNIVILDACRNNPFQAIPDLDDNGLAEMKAPTGTFLSYATAPGSVALDGSEGNSPFTTALAREITVPGTPIEQVFKNVRVDVIDATGGRQTPWDTSSLTHDFFFTPGQAMTEAEQSELQLWESLKDSTDPVPVVLFIRGYPDSKYAPQARALLEKIINSELDEAEDVAAAATPLAETAAPTPSDPAPSVQAAPTPPADTTEAQQELIGIAQASGLAADYQAYLDAFPEGIFAEFAQFELKVIAEKAERAAARADATQTAPKEGEDIVVAAAPSRAATAPMGTELTWTMPFTSAGETLTGKSISQLVTLSPLFPPIEGLPEELWKEQTCSNCHQWTQDALCTQGQTYVSAGNGDAVNKPHPYGGMFKKNVRAWAEGGCK